MGKSDTMINETHFQCQQYLVALYQHHRVIKPRRESLTEVYGEILPASVTKLLRQFEWTTSDVFIDFGSGLGKLVTQVFLETAIKFAYGIEIVPEYHQLAKQVASRIQVDYPALFTQRYLQFQCADFLQTPLPPATFAIINATCFSQKLLCDLGKVINKIPTMHTIFSLRPIPTLKNLKFKKTIHVECSWDSALCFMYAS